MSDDDSGRTTEFGAGQERYDSNLTGPLTPPPESPGNGDNRGGGLRKGVLIGDGTATVVASRVKDAPAGLSEKDLDKVIETMRPRTA